MKEKYIKPVFELEEFKTVDVITTSVTDDNDTPWGSSATGSL